MWEVGVTAPEARRVPCVDIIDAIVGDRVESNRRFDARDTAPVLTFPTVTVAGATAKRLARIDDVQAWIEPR